MHSTRILALFELVLCALICVPTSYGETRNVSTTSELVSALDLANVGDEIVIARGTYPLPSVLRLDTPGITLRGATGIRDDIVLVGGGMNDNVEPRTIMYIENSDITVKDLTVSEAYWNGIHLKGETNLVSGTLISNVKIQNLGQRYIKGSKPRINGAVSDVVIENSYLLQTKDYVQQPGELNDYIGGIDVMVAKNMIIRDNIFEGIQGEDGEGRGAVFLWIGGENALIERNVFINNDRSIGLGNWSSTLAKNDGIYDMDGAVVRNNTILRHPAGDIGVELIHTKDVKVFNNTLYSQDATKDRMLSIMDHGSGTPTTTTGLEIRNNILRGRMNDNAVGDWSDTSVEALGNLVDGSGSEILESWFADVQNGDLHLTELGADATGLAPRIVTVSEDMDRDARTDPTNYGADQFVAIPGDFDHSGLVDSEDLLVWKAGYGQNADGDADNDADTDGRDFLIWQRNMGRSGPTN